MRPVSLPGKSVGSPEARLKWCEQMIANICRASQVDTPTQFRKELEKEYQPQNENLTAISKLTVTLFGLGLLELANQLDLALEIERALEPVELQFESPLALNWKSFINAELTLEGDCQIDNPSSGVPGTSRFIIVKGNDSSLRSITFGDQFGGDVPTITDCTDAKWYRLELFCVNPTHFLVRAENASPPA